MKKFYWLIVTAVVLVACSSEDYYGVQHVKLHSRTDSLNYMAGYYTGLRAKRNFFLTDNSAETVTNFVNALETAYNNKEADVDGFPLEEHVRENAKLIGRTIREQEKESGLMGIEGLETDFDMLKAGLINGLFFDTIIVHPDSVAISINRIISER